MFSGVKQSKGDQELAPFDLNLFIAEIRQKYKNCSGIKQ